MLANSVFDTITLSQSQQTAFEQLCKFLQSDEQVFILKGYAGTGKTTLVNEFCKHLENEWLKFSLMAPTGRASMVMKLKTGRQAATIHKAIYNLDKLEEVQDGVSYKMRYALNLNSDPQNAIYLVDEASMISDLYAEDEFFVFGSGHLLEDLLAFVFETGAKRKIIFIGDGAQLPPVSMNHSPALSKEYLLEKFQLKCIEQELTEVFRQESDSLILRNATEIRHAIANQTFNKFDIKTDMKSVSSIFPEDVLNQYLEKVKENGLDQTTIITYSNEQALKYNQQIRPKLFNQPEADLPLLKVHDKMLIVKNNYNTEIELFNGMFCKIEELGSLEYTPIVRFYGSKKVIIERHLKFRTAKISVDSPGGIRRLLKVCILENVIDDKKGKLDPYLQRALYVDFKNRMAKQEIKYGSKEFKDRLRTDPFFNALFLKYGYAITCHKAQGGEWNHVLVDFKVFIGKTTLQYFRWAYTAISRSRQSLVCIDAPSYNCLSNFVVGKIKKLGKVPQDLYYFEKGDEKETFIDIRMRRLNELFQAQQIEMLVTNHQFQINLLVKQNEDFADLSLWYGDKGFTKTTWKTISSQKFKDLIDYLLIQSIIPNIVPFQPKFEFQKDLHDFVIEKLEENEIPLLNLIQREWSDLYYIDTGCGAAALEFFYDKKHMYSCLTPSSMLGEEDNILKNLINQLHLAS